MELVVHSLTGTSYQGEVKDLTLVTSGGQVTILPHHETFSAVVMPGPIRFRPNSGTAEPITVPGGLLDVRDNVVNLWAAGEASVTDLQVQDRIQVAHDYAQALRKEAGKLGLHHAHELVDRSAVRLGVTKLRRRTHRPRSMVNSLPHDQA